ncbi:hypothetical protein ES705_46472 [subsurface metagenome]
MKFKYKCDVCGKQLRSKRALVGHTWLAHNKRIRVGNPTSEVVNPKLKEEDNEQQTTIEETLLEFTEKMTLVDEGIAELKELGIKRDEFILKILELLEEKPANPGKPENPEESNLKKSDEKKKKKSLVHSLLYDD